MVSLYKITISKSKFDTIPEDERLFFLLGGHVLNELNTLNKILLMCNDYDDKPGISAAGTTQSLLFVRILVGKIYETWLLINKKYLNKLEDSYAQKFAADNNPQSKEAIEAFNHIKAYFEKDLDKNGRHILEKIRNNYSFHSYDEQGLIKNSYNNIPETEPFEMYLGGSVGNGLYYLSEVTVSHAMLESIVPGDKHAAMEKIVNETQKAVGWFNDFIGGYLAIVTVNYLGKTFEELNAIQIEVPGADLKQVKIPYFVLDSCLRGNDG